MASYDPPTPTNTHSDQNHGVMWLQNVASKFATNENALTQPKFEIGITGIIQNVFQGDYTTKQKQTIVGKQINYFPREGAGGTPPWKIP